MLKYFSLGKKLGTKQSWTPFTESVSCRENMDTQLDGHNLKIK